MQHDGQDFYLYKILRAHILPLTNCEFNKAGDKCVAAFERVLGTTEDTLLHAADLCRFITGSYDRTCRVWETSTGRELAVLEGHSNVVYAIAFNNPFG